MKNTLPAALILIYSFAKAQSIIPAPGQTFNTVIDLRKSGGTNNVQVLVNGRITANDGLGGAYMWSDTCTQTDDSLMYVKAATVTTGRWMRLKNNNVVKGSSTFSDSYAFLRQYPAVVLHLKTKSYPDN